ncbi:unnamed protein product [Caenorhabditis sp. 36 PRJEB53466]|nr:unnamed protein product [Caenorhabditis sp. 36 PRJEB53466]
MSTFGLIKIDSSARLILDYVEKLRGPCGGKRQKLQEPSLAVRPNDFPGIDIQKLSDTLVRLAFNGSYIDRTFHRHILGLVVDESLAWNHVLHSIVNTKVGEVYMKCQMCHLAKDMIHFVQIRSFDDGKHADALLAVLSPTFNFLTQLILDVLSDEDDIERMQTEFETSQKPYEAPLDALSALIHDKLCNILLSMPPIAQGVRETLDRCCAAFKNLKNRDGPSQRLMEMLVEHHAKVANQPKFEYKPKGLNLFKYKNPSIRALVSIFACFKYNDSSEHVANTVQTFAEIMDISWEEVIFDLLHGAILLKCEESMELLHLPKQHRVDFRWQSTAFFYKKLPQIIACLVGSGKVTPEDVRAGLEKALNELTMMFDVADTTWQNASFLTLLNELEQSIGKEATDELRTRRRAHMKTNANLIALAESDDKVIENTDIHRLLTAVKEVMNLEFGHAADFHETFKRKIRHGEYDDFDAITAILMAEGKLMQAGHTFSKQNRDAQENRGARRTQADRMKDFDETFLLLARILIKNPSLSIKFFVNGGYAKTDAERSIFFNWSMWYIKRVTKNENPEGKTEEEREMLRQEAAMLVRVANSEVGIEADPEEEMGALKDDDDDEEDDDDDEVKEDEEMEAEEVKEEEKPEAQEDAQEEPEEEKEKEPSEEVEEETDQKPDEEEPMDTSEALEKEAEPAEVEAVEPAENPSEKPAEGSAEGPSQGEQTETQENEMKSPKEDEEKDEEIKIVDQTNVPGTVIVAKTLVKPEPIDDYPGENPVVPSPPPFPAPSTVRSLSPAPVEEPTEKTEKEPRSPPEPEAPTTWNALHCPLPRISKKTGKKYLTILKEGHPFWETDCETLNMGALIAVVPVIGKLLLEEHEDRRHRINRRSAEENMVNLLHAIEPVSCLFLCLVQWLDCEKDSPARTSLAITLASALDKCATATEKVPIATESAEEDSMLSTLSEEESDPALKWQFIRSTLSQIFTVMVEKAPTFPEVTCITFSSARRFCPFVERNEKPDQVKLKHAWYYMRQQAWASPHALRLVDHMNAAGEFNTWIHLYINKIVKTRCAELMKASTEILCRR